MYTIMVYYDAMLLYDAICSCDSDERNQLFQKNKNDLLEEILLDWLTGATYQACAYQNRTCLGEVLV